MKAKNYYPYAKVAGFSQHRGNCTIVIGRHFCGYVSIPAKDLPGWKSYNEDYLDLLNVHGGITYYHLEEGGKVVIAGFDCAHAGDEDNDKLKSVDYLFQLCEVMEQQLREHAKHIKKFRSLKTVTAKLKHMDKIRSTAKISSDIPAIPAMIAASDAAQESKKK